MAKDNQEKILVQSLDQIMSDRFGRYSKYIIQGRALPDARDGLKPVQRRILFSMSELGLWNNKSFKKSARVVGDVIGKYHPHGDSSIYEAMVRMSQNWKMNAQLIEMHGNNGSIDDDPAAAMRYTEVRLSKISELLLDNIKKDTITFAPNFDDSESEPTVLPGLLPNLLINGAKGIASGYATEMPPHNLGEVIGAIIEKIKNPKVTLPGLMKHMKGPDFPTGGTIQGLQGIKDAFKTGKGRIVIRSKFEINDLKTKPAIIITEIPYMVNKSKLVRQIDDIRFNKKIDGIKEVRDESDRKGITINIELNPGTNPDLIVKYLLSKTDMQVYYTYNNIAIVDHAPEQMGVSALIDAYLAHQVEIQTKAISYELNRDTKRLEIVEGLIKVAEIADEVVKVIRKAKGKKDVVDSLKSKFAFTERQANAIAELRLYRLSLTDQTIYIEERDALKTRITAFKKLLKNQEDFDVYLVNQLEKIREEFATPRKSVIESEMEKIEVNLEELIKHEDVWVGVSRKGYVKKFSNRAYESNELKGYGLKDDDTLVYLQQINTANKVLVFTSNGKYIFVPGHKFIEQKWKDIGKHINDFAPMDATSTVVGVIAVADFNLNALITTFTAKGKAKRTEIKEFEVTRYTRALTSMKLGANDRVISVRPTNDKKEIIAISETGKAVKYKETQIPVQGIKSGGVNAMGLAKEDKVAMMVSCNKGETIGIVSQRGGAKRIKVSEVADSAKTTQGKRIFKNLKGNPHIPVDARPVTTKTPIIFRNEKAESAILTFKDVPVTDVKEGFSLIGPKKTVFGGIVASTLVEEGNFKAEKISDDEKFKDAEDKLDKLKDLNLDKILGDL